MTKGANINKPNYSGITPIQSANSSRHEGISKILATQEGMVTIGSGKPKIPTLPSTATTSTDSSKKTKVGTPITGIGEVCFLILMLINHHFSVNDQLKRFRFSISSIFIEVFVFSEYVNQVPCYVIYTKHGVYKDLDFGK